MVIRHPPDEQGSLTHPEQHGDDEHDINGVRTFLFQVEEEAPGVHRQRDVPEPEENIAHDVSSPFRLDGSATLRGFQLRRGGICYR